MPTESFRAIIIGAGPVGLMAAHALGLAGIDFIVLESRHSIFEDVGASLVLSPPTMRIMQQLGVFDAVQAIGYELRHSKSFTVEGYQFRDNTAMDVLQRNHGISLVAFHRAQLIKAIYDGLPESSKKNILLGKKMTEIASVDEGVVVNCDDNSTYKGSIVIGADGVHSKTRRLMRQLAQNANLGKSWDPEVPFTSSYKCLWCSFPRLTEPGNSFDTQHKDLSVMYISGRERAWMFLYKRLPQATKERSYYSDEDVVTFAEEFSEYPVTENYKVKDAFAQRLTAGMSNLEEGILKHWSFGRIVLAGDACHKFTPNAGLGFNNGVQDVVALCNGLQEATSAGHLGAGDIESIFKAYEILRRGAANTDASFSAHTTRLQAWANVFYYFASRYLAVPAFVDSLMMEYLSRSSLRHGLVLKYVTTEERLKGNINWTYGMGRYKKE